MFSQIWRAWFGELAAPAEGMGADQAWVSRLVLARRSLARSVLPVLPNAGKLSAWTNPPLRWAMRPSGSLLRVVPAGSALLTGARPPLLETRRTPALVPPVCQTESMRVVGHGCLARDQFRRSLQFKR